MKQYHNEIERQNDLLKKFYKRKDKIKKLKKFSIILLGIIFWLLIICFGGMCYFAIGSFLSKILYGD